MSGSTKKKLRKESAAAALTEKQRREQAEARKLKTITVTFVSVLLVIVLVATSILTVRGINNSGIIDRNTIAAVTGTHELDSIQMNYFFVDYVKSMYSQWESSYGTSLKTYLSIMGLNTSAPLSEQVNKMAENTPTWSEYFLTGALDQAKSTYALYDKAMAEGFTLTKEEEATLEYNSQLLAFYAAYGGFANSDKYLKSIYGYGADEDSYKEYSRITAIASAYYNKHSESLVYNDAAIREHEKDKFDNYSSFTYAVYNVYSSNYLEVDTTDKNGTKTYTDEQKAAALKAAEDVANKLATSATLEDFDKAIKELDINKNNSSAASTKYDRVAYTNVAAAYKEWIGNKDRQANDMTVIPIETTTTNADGKESKSTTGYYVIYFTERNDNLRPLANVRHLLVKFEGGTTDSSGNTTYTDAEKKKAKAEAEKLLQEWKDGKATEESFIELVKEHSDDSSAAEGGLFEDIHPKSSYVESFLNWSIDANRKPGDVEIIESKYGYHIMYYSSDDELTYRDYMITEDLRSADMDVWYEDITKPTSITTGKTNRLKLGLIIDSIV